MVAILATLQQCKLSWVDSCQQLDLSMETRLLAPVSTIHISQKRCKQARLKTGENPSHTAVPGGAEQPALGESWRNQPHTRVLLARQDRVDPEGNQGGVDPQRRATLLASLLAPVGSSASFRINAEGVFGAPSGGPA